MSRFLSNKLSNLQAYTPGEQPKKGEYIKLNTNENPYPPPPSVGDIARKVSADLQLYSDNTCQTLTKTFADYYQTSTERVIFANGSDEILAFCFMAFCDDLVDVCFPEISYGFYEVFAQLFGVKAEKIPLQKDLSINFKDYFQKGKTIIIANPNAPTGIILPLSEIEEIVVNNPEHLVIIDEAYVDFGGESARKLTEKYDNLLVCGTFSKSRNLAGARLGYAIANEGLIQDLNKIKYSFNPYNVNSLTQALGVASLTDEAYFQECCQKIIKTRAYFMKELKQLGFLVLESRANFVFVSHPDFLGEDLFLELKNRKILMRHFTHQAIKDYLRITIGTQGDMETVVENLKEIVR